ncbi:MAG: hypothetical protein GX967_03050 [Clostridiales bacterium]|nr:hypothetical protein [Clostridiales bacterium]
MAFLNVDGVEVQSPSGDNTYIISDYFTIFSDNSVSPTIYSWHDVTGIYENIGRFEINLKRGEKVILQKEWFNSVEEILSCRAIMEAQSKENFKYRHLQRVLPNKTSYINADLPENTLVYKNKYNYEELLQANIAITTQRILKYIWLCTFILSIITFFMLRRHHANIIDDVWADMIISILIALTAAIMLSLIYYLIDKSLIRRMKKSDEALGVSICFIISPIGIAAIEECINTFNDIIPWSEVNSYSVTDTMLIFAIKNHQKLWLPINSITAENYDWIINVVGALNVPEKQG